MKKPLFIAILGTLCISSAAMSEDFKLKFKYTDNTIESVIVWQKLCECAGYTRAASDYIADFDLDLAEVYFSRADDFVYLAKEQLKLDRKIDDDAALTIMSEVIDLEEYGASEAIEYYREAIANGSDPKIKTKEQYKAEIELSYSACDSFARELIKDEK